jgi:23S rRNA pseudouridine2605 synthase
MLRKPIHHTGLARALSKSGYCSRSSAEKLIRAGRVRLNGRVARGERITKTSAID